MSSSAGCRTRGNALEAAAVNETALEDFQKANPALVYVDEIKAEHVKRYWAWLRKQGLSDRTVYNRHLRLTGFLRFCRVDYKAWELRAPKFEKKLPNVYEPDEIDRMMKATRREYHRVLIQLLAKSGLRDQEVQHLCWSDVNFASGVLRVTGKKEYDWQIKDYEQRDIPIPADLLVRLKAWREKNKNAKLVLPNANGGPNVKLLPMLKGIAKRANVDNATLHRFRRTYATTLLRGGMDVRTVQMLMGHNDLESTMRYLSPATSDEVRLRINAILK